VVQSVVRGTSERDDLSAADWLDLRRDIKSLESVSALRYSLLNLTGTGEPIQLQGFAVTSRFFDALAGHTMLGRAILPSEEDLGKDRVVVLSHALWLAQFGADPHVIGRIIQLGAICLSGCLSKPQLVV
jgi:hypothetical protein